VRVDPNPDRPDSVLPNFCRAQALLPVVFVMQLVATILTLADLDGAADAATHYVFASLYLQWLGMTCAALLCGLRGQLTRLPPKLLFLACWALLLVVTLLVSIVGWKVASWIALPGMVGAQERFVLSNVTISALISPLLLRYFWVQNQWREQVQAEGEARYQALHARIRPHFLFNALNSVAALIAIKPREAEAMVEDLADLFRASLGKQARVAPLKDEIEVVRAYLRIEQIRLGEKLRVDWALADDVLDVPFPPLALQPLVENAVLHGVSRARDGGTIRITAQRKGEDLVVEVESPMAPTDAPSTPGSGTAVRNIAQRLSLIYGERAQVEIGAEGDVFRATLRVPATRRLLEGA
jgi:two-component system sensor histidine kinase AlgZ